MASDRRGGFWWLAWLWAFASAIVGTLLALAVNAASDPEYWPTPWSTFQEYPVRWAAGLTALLALTGVLLALWQRSLVLDLETELNQATDAVRARLEAAVEEAAPATPQALEDDLNQVSGTLAAAVARLHGITDRAQAFEAEVRGLVEKADAAKATAALHEDDARRIGLLLGVESHTRLKEEIKALSETHAEQIEKLTKSGSRTAWFTFVAGVIAGFFVNILTTWITS